MKVTGFTFVRNAIKFDYPVVESITSILPLCDEFVVAVGKSEDQTLDLIQSIGSPKIRIMETVWDDKLRQGGQVLADETNKAMDAIGADTQWAFYLQADEVVHEKYHDIISKAMHAYLDDRRVEGLLLNYTHFYGSYSYTGASRRWYRREIRIIRHNPLIRSYRDAQGFRIQNRKLKVILVPAAIYHYGWVKPPAIQQLKAKSFHKLWHNDRWVEENVSPGENFNYSKIDELALFTGTHPKVMQARIEAKNWQFDYEPTYKTARFKDAVLLEIENLTGWRLFEYRNYKLLGRF